MKKTLVYKDNKSHKFWEVEANGKVVTTRWGRFGTDGQTKSTTFSDAKAAKAQAEKQAASKMKKGYAEAIDPTTLPKGPTRTKKKTSSTSKKPVSKKPTSKEVPSAWSKLLAAKDLNRALTKHFAPLADSPGFEPVLEAIFANATGVRTTRKGLEVSFADEEEVFLATPPLDEKLTGYPASAKKLFKRHRSLHFGDDLNLSTAANLDFGIYYD